MHEQRYFRAPLLAVLSAAGGSMSRARALDAMETLIGSTLGPGDRRPLEDRGSEEGWRNRTSWEVKDLKTEGFLQPTHVAGHGIWALTAAGTPVAVAAVSRGVGMPFVQPTPPSPVAAADPFDVDPDLVDRALLSHHELVAHLADWVQLHGHTALLPTASDPRYDLAWWITAHSLAVVEVKSLTTDNEERQLRLGLGQVLRYRHQLECRLGGVTVEAWLMVEREPTDCSWLELTADLNVRLAWPASLT